MSERIYTPSLTATRTLGALALVVVGGVHYQQYRYAFYASIPTIGPLFLANFIGATALGLFLLTPITSRLGRRGRSLHRVAALAGIGVAAGGLVALLISEHTPVFDFMEHGYRFVIVLAIASDAVAIALLAVFLVRARISPRIPRAVPDARAIPHAARWRARQPTTRRPGGRNVVAVTMPKLLEITIPGLSMKADYPAVRHRLLADFPSVLEVVATTTPATVQIVFRGQEELNAWLDALSDSVATRRMALGRSHICATAHASSAA